MRLAPALALTTLAGAAYGLAFPLVGWWPLAWVALVPFLVAVAASPPRRAFGLGAWLGVVASYGVGTWMPTAVVNYYEQSLAVGLAMFLACALWQSAWQWGLFALVYRRLAARRAWWTPLAVAAVWVAAEAARVWIPFGNPWALLGYALVPAPIFVQVADLAGVFGVSFVLMTVNAALATRRGLATAALVVALVVAYGAVALRGTADELAGALPVATVQGNLDLGTQWKPEFYGANLGAYADLTIKTTAAQPARLVIWPESALTFFLETEASYRDYLASLLAHTKTTLLAGGPRLVAAEGGSEEYRNAAFVVAATGDITDVYEKRTLVPFAEYFPLPGLDLLRRQFGKVREFTPGSRQAPLATPVGAAGVTICNEGLLGGETTARVRAGAEWLVTLTNDSWVGQHQYAEIAFAMARLRAVEVRRWLVRSSTSGPSAIVDPWGRVIDLLPFGTAGVARGEIVPRRDLTIYARVGDAFVWVCVLATLAIVTRLARRR